MTRALVVIALAATACESRASLLGDLATAPGADQRLLSDSRADGPAENGQPCAADGQCRSGYCRDGVCCAVACSGPCSRCNEPGRAGSCTPWPAGTVCRAAACEPGADPTKLKLAHHCDGQGACTAFAPDQLECAPFGCDPARARCFASCSAALPGSCKKGVSCDGAGRCGGELLPLGAPCSVGQECASGSCVEGVCCSSACTNACERCALAGAEGRCLPAPAGTAPAAGKSCPTDPSNPCGSDGACDGKRGCRVSPASTPCGPVSCNGSTLVAHVCSGDPSGPACVKQQSSCGAYRCQPGGSSCFGSCTTAAQCSAGYLCTKGRCVQCASADDCKPGETCVDDRCI